MKIDYDQVADALYFRLKGGLVVESEEIKEGVIIDYDEEGTICGIEILAYSKRNLDLNRLIKMKEEELVAEVSAT